MIPIAFPLPCPVPVVCSAGGSLAGGISSSLASAAASGFFDMLKAALADAANWMVGHVIDLVDSTTSIRLSSGWFLSSLQSIQDIAVLVVLPILMAASIGPVLKQDLRRLFRVWGVGLPVAVLAGVLGIQFVQLALVVTDSMCSMVSSSAGNALSSKFASMMVSSLVGDAPVVVTMLVSLLLIAGTLLVWLELVVRSASVYLAAFFMPLSLVTFVWPATAGVAKRTIEILAALILSKFVIVAGLTLGLAAVSTASTTDDTIAGAAILLLSGFAPFALLRLAPIVETAAIGHLEGLSRRPARAAARAVTTAAGARSHPAVKFLMSKSSSAEGGQPASSGRSAALGGRSAGSASGSTPSPGRLTERSPDFRAASGGPGDG